MHAFACSEEKTSPSVLCHFTLAFISLITDVVAAASPNLAAIEFSNGQVIVLASRRLCESSYAAVGNALTSITSLVSTAIWQLSLTALPTASPAEVTSWFDALFSVASLATALCGLSDSYLRAINARGAVRCDETVKFLAGSMLASHGKALFMRLRCVAQYVDWYWRHHSLPGYAHASMLFNVVGYKTTHVLHTQHNAEWLTPTFDTYNSSTIVVYNCSCGKQYPECDSTQYVSSKNPKAITSAEAKVTATMMLGWRA